MRPVRLELEGFTSFRRNTVVDFAGLRLFAITGATGAGKTSLIDAMLYALFGRTPRISRGAADLISQGAAELKVLFEFEAGGEHYRTFRHIKRKGAAKQRLDQRVGDGESDWDVIADKSGAIDSKIRHLLGLDYDGFTKTIALPQGEFDKFLRGEASKRREILIELLGLDIYAKMMQKANQRSLQFAEKARLLEDHLKTQLAGVNEQSIPELEARLAAWQAAAVALEDALERINAAGPLQRRVREIRKCAADLSSAQGQLAPLQSVREQLLATQVQAHERLAAAEEQAAAAKAQCEQLEANGSPDLLRRQAEDIVKAQKTRAEIDRQKESLKKLVAELPAIKSAANDAEAGAAAAEAALEKAIQANAALDLRKHLHEGEECPVCEQLVLMVPQTIPDSTVDEARAAHANARKALKAAQDLVHARMTQIRTVESSIKTAEAAVKDAAQGDPQQLLHRAQEIDQARAEARRADSQLASLRQAASQAKDRLTQHEMQQKLLEQRVTTIAEQLASLAAGDSLEELERQLGDLALRDLEADRRRIDSELRANHRQRAETEASIDRIATLLREAEQKQADVREWNRQSELSKRLGGLLREDRFQAFVIGQTTRRLAAEGTRQLKHLSSGRYSFTTEGDEFLVVDHWNADDKRSVNTLSGGESFLASLSLALALSKSLPDFSVNRDSIQLDSLFLDEGFSTLDTETMQIVLDAIELLQADGRTIGVISHVSELAERLPARIEVAKSPGGSAVTIRK